MVTGLLYMLQSIKTLTIKEKIAHEREERLKYKRKRKIIFWSVTLQVHDNKISSFFEILHQKIMRYYVIITFTHSVLCAIQSSFWAQPLLLGIREQVSAST